MTKFLPEQMEIEEKEYEVLKKLNFIFNNSLETFNSRLKDSMNYIYYITLPIVMASLETIVLCKCFYTMIVICLLYTSDAADGLRCRSRWSPYH